MSDLGVEKLGLAIERLENINGAMQLPMSDGFHMKTLRVLIPEVIADLNAAYLDLGGDNGSA